MSFYFGPDLVLSLVPCPPAFGVVRVIKKKPGGRGALGVRRPKLRRGSGLSRSSSSTSSSASARCPLPPSPPARGLSNRALQRRRSRVETLGAISSPSISGGKPDPSQGRCHGRERVPRSRRPALAGRRPPRFPTAASAAWAQACVLRTRSPRMIGCLAVCLSVVSPPRRSRRWPAATGVERPTPAGEEATARGWGYYAAHTGRRYIGALAPLVTELGTAWHC